MAMLMMAGLSLSSCSIFPSPKHDVGTLELGADLALSGDDASDGIPVRNAIELALRQAGRVCGASAHSDACVALQAVFVDDVTRGIHDPATGAQNVRQLVATAGVVGIVGPLYDSLARSEIPVASASHLVMISPAATDECLTLEPPDGHCHQLATQLRPGGANNFYRVVANESAQGAAGAQFAYTTLKARTAFIVDDSSPLGQELARDFQTAFVQEGGKLRTTQSDAAVIYFAGADLTAAARFRQEMAGSLEAPLIGSDLLATDQFAKLAGANVRGSYFTVIGPYAASIATAQGFLHEYRQTYAVAPGIYSLPAFDATNVLIAAIARAIDDAGGKRPSRSQVLAEVAKTSDFHGAMGTMSFDSHGDTTLKLLTAYEWLAPSDPAGKFVAEIALP